MIHNVFQEAEAGPDCSEGRYGVMRMIQSTERIDRKILNLKELTADIADQKVWVRARLQTSRSKGGHNVNITQKKQQQQKKKQQLRTDFLAGQANPSDILVSSYTTVTTLYLYLIAQIRYNTFYPSKT